MGSTRLKFEVYHLATDTMCEIPRKLLELAWIRKRETFAKPVIRPMFEVQYNEFRTKVARKYKYVDDRHPVMIFCNGLYIMMKRLLEILTLKECPAIMVTKPQIEPSWTAYLEDPFLVNPLRDYIFFNIHINRKHVGYLITEIFTDLNPKITKVFINKLIGESVPIGNYHVFKEGWLEFGIGPASMPMRGNNHHPTMTHNKRGILSFCGEYNLDCDAFFIHFVPCKFFDDYHTVLGKVVHGENILKQIEDLESEFGKLKKEMTIHSCGIVPIGRNKPQEIQDEQEWVDSICQLFSLPKIDILASSVKLSGNMADKLDTQVVCPLFQQKEEIVFEFVGEDSSTADSLESTGTPEYWDEPLDIGTITLNYPGDTPSISETSSQRERKEEMGDIISVAPRVKSESSNADLIATSLLDVTQELISPSQLKLVGSEEDIPQPIDEIHSISLTNIKIKDKSPKSIKEASEEDLIELSDLLGQTNKREVITFDDLCEYEGEEEESKYSLNFADDETSLYDFTTGDEE